MTPIYKQLEAVQTAKLHLEVKQQALIEKGLTSTNPNDILRASSIANANVQPKQQDGERKSYIVDPYQFNQFLGYKNKPFALSYAMLKRLSYQVPIVRSIIGTRLDQITSFCEPQDNKYSTGFVIRKKKNYYDGKDAEPTKQELRRCQELTEFMLNCGIGNNFDGDDFDTFTRKIMNDSYMYDQMAFEVVRNKKGLPVNFYAVDSSTIRIADSYDDANYEENRSSLARKEYKGYYPSYCQIENGSVVNDFYPWEMCLGIRNPVTDIYANGYGVCEIEILMNVLTSMLYGDEYNRRFFSQGSAPKGFLKIKSGSMINTGKMGDFKQAWQSMMAGVVNSHKTPILEGDVEWVDLQHTNRDMEFSNWQEYLIKLACAIFRIDPAEINFPLSGGAEQKSMFEGNNEARLKHSKDKGLYPVLKYFSRKINKYIISQIDPEYEFAFVGLDGADIGEELDQDIKMVGAFMTVDEIRVRRGLKPVGEEKGGNLILNSIWMQKYTSDQQMAMQKEMQAQGQDPNDPNAQPQGNDDQQEEQEGDDYNWQEQSGEDPFEKAFNSYLETLQKAA